MRKNKKILILHNAITVGGAEQSLLDFLAAIMRNKNKQYLFYIACPQGTGLPDRLNESGVEVISLPLIRLRRTANPLSIINHIIQICFLTLNIRAIILAKKIDLVHANNTVSFVQGLLAAKSCHVPLLWHVRDINRLPLLNRILCRFADGVIAISRAVAATLNDKKLAVIYNGISIQRTTNKLPEVHRWQSDAAYLVMVAQLVPWKRHDLLIDAMSMLRQSYPELKLFIVGDDMFTEHKQYTVHLRRRIYESGLADSVFLCGYQEHALEFIKHSLLLIHPADDEPLGRAVVEAMLLRKPVVAADSGGIPEYISNEVNGFLFAPGNVADLVRQVKLAMNHPQLETIIENAYVSASKNFHIDKQSHKVSAVYDELLEGKNGDAR